ncbi:MAG: AbrB/MazE/SpoVT family DNA-binding domain-containing protein [Alphaproteobacteria bacterium]|nr:AbrB/MazE/SpoVT family DNA-binding domain-containing protein [Alphaproteobacteria bacterium]
MVAVRLQKVGNSIGLVLPDEVLARLGVGLDDTLHLIAADDGILLSATSATDPEFEAQMAVARKLMRKRQDVLRELAK